jgi:hypothetical protein
MDWGPTQDATSDRIMAAVLDVENPVGPFPACRRLLPPSHESAKQRLKQGWAPESKKKLGEKMEKTD